MKTSSNHQSNILNNRSASTINREQQKKSPLIRGKSEWQKNALRICGNWSEQLSSKGKVYFYNCITEVSQWQKPADWTLPDVNKKELLKIISERPGFDGSSIKRTYATLAQNERNRSRQFENSSPKRQKCCQDPSRSTSELTRPTESSSHHEAENLSAVSGTNATKDHFRQLADDIRESLQNILTKASMSAHSNNVNCSTVAHTPFIHERSLSSSESSSISATGVGSKPLDSKSLNPLSIFQPLRSLKDEHFKENSRNIPISNLQTASSTCDISPSNSKLSDARSNVTSLSRSPRNNPSSFGGLLNGDCTHRHVSDIMRQLDSSASKQRFDFPIASGNSEISSNPSDLKRNIFNRSLISDLNIQDIPLSNKLSTSSIQPKNNVSPSGNLQKQNLSDSETIRTIVTFLNTVVHARRDSPSSNTTPNSSLRKILPPLNSSSMDSTPSNQTTYRAYQKIEDLPVETISYEGNSASLEKDPVRPLTLKSECKTVVDQSFHEPFSSCTASHDTSPHSRISNPVYIPACSSTGLCFDPANQISHSHISDSLPQPSEIKNDSDDINKISIYYRDRLSVTSSNSIKPETSEILLEHPEILKYVDPCLSSKFQNSVADSAEIEANCEFRKFHRLHSVLYSELSGELKKLRALVRISETKLNIHQKRKEALQDLMDVLEVRKSFSSLIQPDCRI